MILVPNEKWQWFFDQESNHLMLDLTDGLLFSTPFSAKQLIIAAQAPQEFTLDDVSRYFHLLECIGELPFSEPERVQMVLNAVAVARFAKPQMVRSRYFRTFAVMKETPLFGEVVSLVTEFGHADFMVVEPGDSASVVMLLSGQLGLENQQAMQGGEFIKVMNDRLIPFHAVSSQLLRMA
jgi:Protein of unknown function (DUF1379).